MGRGEIIFRMKLLLFAIAMENLKISPTKEVFNAFKFNIKVSNKFLSNVRVSKTHIRHTKFFLPD